MLGQLLAVFWVMDLAVDLVFRLMSQVAVNFLTSRCNPLEDGAC